ncbi:MAG: PBP1A family penicillin-binding protein [Rickettsiales bacterium]|nr:PBP1A family penicillin-binding protein [Rickettsiales bacterium]
MATRIRFKYRIARGASAYRCGPGIRKNFRYRAPRGLWGSIVHICILLGIWGAVAGACALLYLAFTLPDIDKIVAQTRQPSITIIDRHGEKIISINDMYGAKVSIETLPPHVWQAIVATEDKRFFTHYGVDMRGLARALWRNVRSDRIAQGGSTLTQQLAKNLFLSSHRTMARKIQELMITLWLERKFSKAQILSLYLNRISLVGGKYGISTAAEQVFGKEIGRITVPESAILAGMLKSPAKYNPAANPEASLGRMRVVLGLMRDQGYINEEQYAEALEYKYTKPTGASHSQTRYFIDYVMSAFESYAGNVESDVIIRTTLDLSVQRTAEGVARDFTKNDGARYGFKQISAVFMNTGGEILAMVGGLDYAQSQFNRTTQMKRQPGSAFKPFVYLAALIKGMKPTDMFEDKPTAIGDWEPKNHDGKYLGEITMARALEQSVNTVPVAIAKKIGLDSIIAAAQKLGLVDKISRDYSIILGTSETTLLDLTAAYAAFANGGAGVIPHGIINISSEGGKTLFERKGSGVGRLMTPEQAADMNAMLRQVVQGGTGSAAFVPGADIRGKTGTSQNNRDAWFIGFSDKYAGGVWIGNDDSAAMSEDSYGGLVPARVFKAVMTYMLVRK